MFKRRTLFIVGAGASQEVGFPTGPDLALRIADNLKPRDDEVRGTITAFQDEELYHEIVRHVGTDNQWQKLQPYLRAAERMHSGVALSSSIDDFLSIHEGDPCLVELGKAAIVRAILRAERESDLYIDQSNIHNRMDFRKIAPTW